jgi:protein TonB
MNRLKQLIEWVKCYPLGLAIAASLMLHAGTLVAAHFFLQETAPQPLAIQTIALVVIEQPSPPSDKAPPKTVAPMAPTPKALPKVLRVNTSPPRQTKPTTPDPRSAALAVPPPLFKAPPRRPILNRPALTPPDPAPIPSTPRHTATKPFKTAKVAPPTTAENPPLTPPRYGIKGLTNPPPRYPWLARQRGEHGRVVVRVAVDRSGQVINAEIAQSSGYGRLDRSALSTLRRWRFVPARRGTAPVTATVEVPVTFRLSDN